MLDKHLIDKKNYLDKLIKKNTNDFDLIANLRKECERIDLTDKDIILDFDKATFKISKKLRRVKSITIFDEALRKYKEIQF